MASYKCRIADSEGRIKSRIVQAHDPAELGQKIENDGLMLISYRKSFEFKRSNKSSSLYIFTNQLKLLVESGAIMDDAIQVIQQSTESDPLFSGMLVEVRKQILRGSSLSDALGEHLDYFDPLYCRLIKVGEKTGNLSEVLSGLLEFQKKKTVLVNRAKAIVAYPAIVLLMIFSIMGFLSFYIIPRFKSVFSELDVDIPPLTEIVFALSGFLTSNSLIIFPVLVALFISFLITFKKNREAIANFCLYLPVISTFIRNYYLLIFSLSMKILLKGGVQLVDSIELIADGFPKKIRNRLLSIHQGIVSGNSFSSLLSGESLFPPIFTGLLKIGEKTGRLTEIFENLYEYYYEDFQNRIDLLTGMIEPVIILILGITIGTIVVSLFVPLVSFMSQMK